MSAKDAPILLTIEEVAEVLRLQPETVRQMARDGRVPAHKIGKVWRFGRTEIEQWVREAPSYGHGHSCELTLPLDDLPTLRSNGYAFKDPAFGDNRNQPVHRWVPWIAGFSAGFVGDCLEEYLPPHVSPETAMVLDPFAGVGTTLVEAYRRGFNTCGFEINPYAALASRAKLEGAEVPLAELQFWIQVFRSSMRDVLATDLTPPTSAPPSFRSRIPFFSEQIERQVLFVLSFIRGLTDQRIRDLFLIAFGSV